MTDFVDVIIRSVSEQSSARLKTKKAVLSHLNDVKDELSRVRDLLVALKEQRISREQFQAKVQQNHAYMVEKLNDRSLSLDELLEQLEQLAIQDEMQKVEALFGRLTSRKPWIHGQWQPFWSPSIFGQGSKLRRTMALVHGEADKFNNVVGDGNKFNALYHEFERLKKIITQDIPELREALQNERQALFTDPSLFDREHYLRFLRHCDSIEMNIGMQSEFVKQSGTDLSILIDNLKSETLFEVHNYYVDLLLHYLFQSYKTDNSHYHIFYLAEELMKLLSQGAILDVTYLNNWRSICDTKKKVEEAGGIKTLELKTAVEQSEQAAKDNAEALDQFILALYRAHHPHDDEETAKQEMAMQDPEAPFSKKSLYAEIVRNNQALKNLFCYRFIQTVLQVMSVGHVEKACTYGPLMRDFVLNTLSGDAESTHPIHDMEFLKVQTMLPPKYWDAERMLFDRIKASTLDTIVPHKEYAGLNFMALKRAPDCYRARHSHSDWTWAVDTSQNCQRVKPIALDITPANQFWLLKKFHDFIELVQKIVDRIFSDQLPAKNGLGDFQEQPNDVIERANELDNIFVERFTACRT